MEWKIGEIKQVNGEWYQCVEGEGCYQCAFNSDANTCFADDPHCACRSDKKYVVYKKLEKVGEPTVIRGKPHQKFNNFVFCDSRICQYCAFHHKLCDVKCEPYEFYLEIKQTKEDMEENKLNLKPFDIQKAREGKPVCTRDGRKARIICFDKVNKRPIVALILDDGCEFVYEYLSDGKSYNGKDDSYDLMMLPEKKEGWIIVSKNATIYDSLEDAKKSFDSDKELCICKVEWEE